MKKACKKVLARLEGKTINPYGLFTDGFKTGYNYAQKEKK